MTPDDLAVVQRSWTQLRARRARFLERLEAAFSIVFDPTTAGDHARRLLETADELVGLLATPSLLAAQARAVTATWGADVAVPNIDVDGAAWMRAAGEVCPSWSSGDELAWHHAWLLLDDVLAEGTLAPFGRTVAGDDASSSPRYVARATKGT